jgi:hypothetical protein
MRRLKIMFEEMEVLKNPFGVNDLQDHLKAFCREQGLDTPRFWVAAFDGYYTCYAVTLHLNDNDRCEQFDANVIFMLMDLSARDKCEMETNRIKCIFKDLEEPILLTSKVAVRSELQQRFYKSLELEKIPVRWQDDSQNEYEVYMKGTMEMDAFASVMERVEYIGKEMVYQ